MVILEKVTGFDWDDGNSRKNDRHGVSMAEAEQVFFNTPVLMLPDPAHGQSEPRYHALGKTIDGRRLHVTFTLRGGGKLIRVISARDINRKERAIYEQAT
ncbi:MAG: BrnT family toxin [Steroidobacteraceae bacterium]